MPKSGRARKLWAGGGPVRKLRAPKATGTCQQPSATSDRMVREREQLGDGFSRVFEEVNPFEGL